MDEDLVEQLLQELRETRKTFEHAIVAIRWNKINTIVQYVLISVVVLMLVFGVLYYLDDKREACERGNATRASIQISLDAHAAAIGTALAIVTDAPDARLQEYLEAYADQADPEILKPRQC